MFDFGKKKQKVLLIDDEEVVLSVLSDYISDLDLIVLTAMDGASGIEVAEAEHPDLIMLDARMPKLDGWSTLSALKKNPQTGQIPVLMCTAVSDIGSYDRAFAYGAQGYIIKPIKPLELERKVGKFLALRKIPGRVREA